MSLKTKNNDMKNNVITKKLSFNQNLLFTLLYEAISAGMSRKDSWSEFQVGNGF